MTMKKLDIDELRRSYKGASAWLTRRGFFGP